MPDRPSQSDEASAGRPPAASTSARFAPGFAFLGLQGRLTALLLAVALVPLVLIGYLVQVRVEAAMELAAGVQFEVSAERTLASVEKQLAGVSESIERWAQLNVMYDLIGDDADGRVTAALMTLSLKSSNFRLMAVTPSGKVVASNAPRLLDSHLGNQRWFRALPELLQATTSARLDREEDGFYFTAPIWKEGKRPTHIGYLVAVLSKSDLAAWILNEQDPALEGKQWAFFERDGLFLTGTSLPSAAAPDAAWNDLYGRLSAAQNESVRSERKTSHGWLVVADGQGDPHMAGYAESGHRLEPGKQYRVLVTQPAAQALAQLYDLRRNLLFLRGGLAVLIVVIAAIVARRLAAPLHSLTKSAEALASGDFSAAPLPVTRRDEFGILARTFAKMTEELRKLTQGLEQRVQERTAALNRSNHALETQAVERQRAEAEARASEARFQQIVSQVKDSALTMLDLDGRVIHWNEGAERLKGYRHDEIVGQSFERFYPPDDVAAGKPALLLRLALEKGSADDEGWRVRKDGTTFWAHMTITAMHDEAGAVIGYSELTRDLTDQQAARVERQKLEAQLLQSQKMEAIGRLAGGIAHDFNNLLTVITGYVHMMSRGLKADTPLARAIEEIGKAADRAASLTRQLLAFSRKQIMTQTALSLNQVVGEADRLLRRVIGEDIRLDLTYAEDLPSITADAGQLDQVLMNLVVNARDAMPNGGRILIRTGMARFTPAHPEASGIVPHGTYVTLEVIDTGSGMDAATKAQVFEPFFTTKEQGKGTGLGLSTVYGIVKQSGGYILVESELGHGTSFTIYFPLQQGKAEAQADAPKSRPILRPVPRGPRASSTILLVEDEDSIRKLLQGYLAAQGYKVLTAPDGEAGLIVGGSYSGTINLLVTDVVMPKLNGTEMARRLMEKHPGLKVLYMSGYTDEAIVLQSMSESSAPFLHKPFKPQALLDRVRQVLAGC